MEREDDLFFERVKKSFTEIEEELKGNILFTDKYAEEVLSWSPMTTSILDMVHSVVSLDESPVQQLESIPKDDDFPTKAVFFIGGALHECDEAVKQVLSTVPFSEAIIFVALDAGDETKEAFSEEYTEAMKEALSKSNNSNRISPIVAIIQFPPLLISHVSNNLFFIPSCYSTFPTYSQDSDSQRVTIDSFLSTKREPIMRIVTALNSLISYLNIREDLYPLGQTSTVVAKEIHKALRPEVTTGPQVSLLLIDRTLDLVAPTLHTDSVLDRIHAVLPHPSPISADVRFDMSTLFPSIVPQSAPSNPSSSSSDPSTSSSNPSASSSTTSTIEASTIQVPLSSLAHPNDPLAASALESLLSKREKDALSELRKKIVDTLTRDKVTFPLPKMGNVTAKQLLSLVEEFAKDRSRFFRFNALVQNIAAVILSLQNSEQVHWEELLSIEKILLLSVEDKSQSLLNRIHEVLANPIPGSPKGEYFRTEQILALCICIYSLVGEKGFDWSEERSFQDSLAVRIFDAPESELTWLGSALLNDLALYHTTLANAENKNDFLKKQLSLEVKDRINDIFNCLHSIAALRINLLDFKNLYKASKTGGVVYTSLVQQLCTLLFDEKRPELKDINKISAASIGNLFKLGLGFKGKARPTDNNTVILFIIGGITFNEIREIKELAAKQKIRIVIGSNAVATASYVHNRLFEK